MTRWTTKLMVMVAALAVGAMADWAQADVRYVDDDAPPGGDGQSWTTPYDDLQDALTEALGDPSITEIHVAGGTYYPSEQAEPGTPRTERYRLINGVALSGGYAGLANPINPDVRNLELYESILSGDIGTQDDPNDNCYHVVTSTGNDTTAVLDGVTITAGYANGESTHRYGAGIYIHLGNPRIINCTIIWNTTNGYAGKGGGIYIHQDSSPVLTACRITENHASYGGGLYCYDYRNEPTLSDCVISDNSAGRGGGICCHHGYPLLINCVLTDNVATGNGGGLCTEGGTTAFRDCVITCNEAWRGGGVCSLDYSSFNCLRCEIRGNSAVDSGGGVCSHCSVLDDCLLAANVAGYGGGVLCSGVGQWCLVSCSNCTIINNVAYWGRGSIEISQPYDSDMYLWNCIIWDNLPTETNLTWGSAERVLRYNDVQGGLACSSNPSCEGNIDVDPLFIDPDGPDNDPATWEDNNFRLSTDSPCVDTGDPTFEPQLLLPDLDLDDHIRIWDGEGDGAAIVDMGAYEFGAPSICPGDSNCDGSITWRDIEFFLAALDDNQASWVVMFLPETPCCHFANNDVNADSTVNWRDIDQFVAVMNTTCP